MPLSEKLLRWLFEMRLSMSPAKMSVAKIVSHRELERKLILALEEFSSFEPIDVRQQAGIIEIRRTRDEEAVFAANDRLLILVESLDLNLQRRTSSKINVEDSKITQSLSFVTEVIQSIESEVLEIDKEIATVTLELEQQRSLKHVAESLEPLGLDMGRIGSTEYTFTTAGRIDEARLSKLDWSLGEVTEGTYFLKSLPGKKGKVVCSVSIPVERKGAAERIFTALGFDTFSVPEGYDGSPDDIAFQAAERISVLEKERESLHNRKKLIAKEWGPKILAAWELMKIETNRVSIKSYFVYTESSVKVWGWIPAGSEDKIQSLLKEYVGSAHNIEFDEPDFAEYDSPTYLDNPSIMKPTEDVVTAYGIPSKHDLDPTKIMWLSFPLIFGLVFADVGQGFLILLIGLAAWYAKRKEQDWGQILGYIQNGAEGLVLMGIFAMFGGFLFGSFFGSETVIEPLWPIFAHTDAEGYTNPYRAAHLLKLSIEVGVIQITLGILLSFYNKLKHKEWDKAIIAVAYVWMYLGFINLLFGISYDNINAWFSNAGTVNIWLPLIGIGYGVGDNGVYPVVPLSPMIFTMIALFVPLAIMALLSFKHGMDGTVHFLESGLGMISHTVSYARIFALNTVHVILSGVFFSLLPPLLEIEFAYLEIAGVEIIPHHFMHEGHQVTPHLPLLGAIVGTFIVGILEGLLAFMHTLRLHFVEWFSKFYYAGGVAFSPFVAERLHTAPINRPKPMMTLASNQ